MSVPGASNGTARGHLVVVGTGIDASRHLTPEARSSIEEAEKVLFLVADVPTAVWLDRTFKHAESLQPFYNEDKPRRETYDAIVEHTLSFLRQGLRVCLVSYGHPGVLAYPMHEAVRRAREEGYEAEMLPAISAEDCLFADLGLDLGTAGCRSFDATDFLIHRRMADATCGLILWQIAVTGELRHKPAGAPEGLRVLADTLRQTYGDSHEVVVYEAAPMPIVGPVIRRIQLKDLASTPVTAASTLYVPPRDMPVVDLAMMDRLGMRREELSATAAPGK